MKVANYTLIRLVSTVSFTIKATPTNNTDYSCHTKVVDILKPIIWGIIPLVFNYLRVGTHMHANQQSNFNKLVWPSAGMHLV